MYLDSGSDKKVLNNVEKIYCFIIGIDAFKGKLSDANKKNFDKMIEHAKELEIINFIIVDSIDKIRKIEIEGWYRNNSNSNFGIWLGNGVNDQFSIKIAQKTNDMRLDVPSNFCFVVKAGKPYYVKYVESFEGDDLNSEDGLETL